MNATETYLQPMLEGTKQYIVPLFQRIYTWKKPDWEELWRDLLDIYELSVGRELSAGREHFMGAIVTMPVEMKPQGVQKYLLIDGQQRLTTIFVILSVMRDLAVGESNLPEQIKEQYLINKFGKPANRYKLLPTEADRQSFIEVINGAEKSSSKIADAYKFFFRKLKGRDSDNNSINLTHFHDVMMKQLVFVSVVLDRDDSPYRIFHSLNGTGVPLTQADLVRNHFFMYIPEPDEQKVAFNDLWMPMQNMLGEKELTEFMWRYITKDGTSIRRDGIYDEFRHRTNNKTQEEVIDILFDLQTFADYYHRLISPEEEVDDEIRRRLENLNRWEISTSYPFLLNIYHDYMKKKISANDFCKILDMIESYVIRRFFARIPTNALNKNFIAMYRSLDKTDLLEAVKEYFLTKRWATDEEFIAGLENLPIYTSGRSKTRHILEAVEEAINTNNEPIDTKHPRITIEHILPQTLNKAWTKMLGDTVQDTHDRYLHTLGNLTLTGMNESMGNSSFSDKKEVFSNSGFHLNRYFAEQSVWDEASIKARAKKIAEIALEIWKRPKQEIDNETSDDPTGRKPIGFTLFDKDYDISTWREALIGICTILVYKHNVHFGQVVNRATGKNNYIAYSPDEMRTPIQIDGTPYWFETHLSAKDILRFVYSVLRACGHDEDELEIYW